MVGSLSRTLAAPEATGPWMVWIDGRSDPRKERALAPWWLRSSDDEIPEDSASSEVEAEVDVLAEDEEEDSADGESSLAVEASEATEVATEEELTVLDAPGTADEASPGDSDEEESAGSSGRRRRRRRRKRRPRTEEEEAVAVEPQPSVRAPMQMTSSVGPVAPAPSVAPAASVGSIGTVTEREVLYSPMDRPATGEERKLAMLCDFENIALGVRDSEIKKLDIELILARLLEKGKLIVKKAYADWERYSDYKRPFHEAAIELIDIPQKYYSGKNSADIKLVVDAMDLCYSKEHLDTFVIVSGDSDFSPLVSKLKENNKYVIGIGVKNSSSSLLVDNCDEFIYYEDVWRVAQHGPRLDHLGPKEAEVFGLMCDAMLALIRENKEVLWGSMIKQTMQRKRPSFSESYYGYSAFSELLEDAALKNIISLERDQRSGNYVVKGFVHGRR